LNLVKFVKNRIDPVIPYLKNKTVLDIGCVGMGKHDTMGGKNWLFGITNKLSKRVVGIDINEKGVRELVSLGYNAQVINAEEPFDLNEKFEIITAEEVIEHLSNLGIFLENVKRHLTGEGLFILTSPNAISHSFYLQRLLYGKISDVSLSSHTHWHTEETLRSLLQKHGFKILKIELMHPEPAEPKWWYFLVKIIWWFVPNKFARNILVLAIVDTNE